MNRNELEAAAEERLFDAMLGELAREAAAPARGVAASRWLVAAFVVLGLAVVVGVVMTSRGTPAVAVAPQEPAPLPPTLEVRGITALRKADRQVENLSCAIEGPDFGVLQEFERLRALRVEQDHDLPHPTLVQSAWSLAPVARCTKLESLTVGPLARFTAVELAPIAALPNLRSLELVGKEKVLDGASAAVLVKLPLRSLVLREVFVVREGLRVLGELPLLERLELRDCTGLDRCDLKHLYRLRQLRALTLRGVGQATVQQFALTGEPVALQLPTIRDGRIVREVTADWIKGLAEALPNLRELDLAETRIDDQVLIALPRSLTFLGLRAAKGYGEPGMVAVGALPNLQGLACGEPPPNSHEQDRVPFASWWPVLRGMKLHRYEFAGIPTPDLLDELRQQTDLRELRLAIGLAVVTTNEQGHLILGEGPPLDFGCLGDLKHLDWVALVNPSASIVQAIRRAVGDRVRIEGLAR